jgi:hypothetical protein
VNNSFSGSQAVEQAVAHFHLGYGDLANDVRSKPFSHFEFNAELSDKASQGERGRLSLLTARGTLGGIELHREATAHHTLGALLTYEYYNNPAFEYGGQSVYGGLISDFHKADDKDNTKVRATTGVLLQGIIGATLSEHYYAGEGRNYDYGMGLGTRLAATLVKQREGRSHRLGRPLAAHFERGAVGALSGRWVLRDPPLPHVEVWPRRELRQLPPQDELHPGSPPSHRRADAELFLSTAMPSPPMTLHLAAPRRRSRGWFRRGVRGPRRAAQSWESDDGDEPAWAVSIQAKDLNNVIADTTFTWVTADSQARILHHSLITHGEMDLHVLDANGVEVYAHEVSVVYETDTLTNKGAPGSWTVRFDIKAATGKIDVTLETP